jgi:hypothetical protein
MIEHLPLLTPDPARTDRLRARCHDRLALQRRAKSEPALPKRALLEPAITSGLCVIYFSTVVITALKVLGGR